MYKFKINYLHIGAKNRNLIITFGPKGSKYCVGWIDLDKFLKCQNLFSTEQVLMTTQSGISLLLSVILKGTFAVII